MVGLQGAIVKVEVGTANGLPSFVVVGLPETAALRKEDPDYDLPIALGTLAAAGQIAPECFERTLVMGELSLDGSVGHVRGVLSTSEQ